jgi:mannose/fructose/N-acetylgalactosamine-specific phosphotransferase system component IIB
MNPEQAKDRAKALLNVIETMYEIRITNLEEVIEAIIEKTLDEQKILTICTALNSWVAMNAALRGEVEIPGEVVNGLTGKIMRL